MGSIPLVALAVRDQQYQDPIQTQGRLMSLQALGQQTQQAAALAPGQQQQQQQQLQLGQQAIQQGQFAVQDREAGMKAMQQWDGKDPSQIPDLIQKNGGSLQAVLGAKKAAIESQQSILNLNTAQLAQTKAKNDYLLGKLQAASGTDIPDAQLAPGIVNAAQESVKDGYLQPEEAQKLQQLVQQYPDPKDLRSQLSIYEKGLQGQSTQFSQEQENRKTAAEEQQAQARATAANTSAAEFQAKMPGGPLADPARAEMQDWLTKNPGKGPADFLAYKSTLAVRAQSQGVGGPNDAMVDLVGQRKMDLATALSRMPPAAKEQFSAQLTAKYPDFNQGEFGVAKKVLEKYTSGNVSDQLLAIGTAREHMKTFSNLADALDNGDVQKLNQLGNMLGVNFGSDKASNVRIAASALGGELGRAFDGAGVVGAEREGWEKKLADYLSKGQFKGAISTADSLLAGKQKSAQEAFEQGRNAKPNFGGEAASGGGGATPQNTAASPTHTPGGQATGFTEGATGKGSDGKKYIVRNGVWQPQ